MHTPESFLAHQNRHTQGAKQGQGLFRAGDLKKKKVSLGITFPKAFAQTLIFPYILN